jgi:pimeloyl-ACP methyl ester carboxylesterase/DNA-binding CsgD family transcriptional regulator
MTNRLCPCAAQPAKQPAGGTLQQQIRFCESRDGVRLAYAIVGKGPPLVKASNWLSHVEYDWRSPVWRPFLEQLARARTVIRYDERGCGLSDWDVADLSFESWVTDLETVVDSVGLRRFPLLGMSQGGPIAVAYAVRHPERVSHLIIHGSYARGLLKRDPTPAQRIEVDALLNLIRVGWGRENAAFRQVFTSFFIPGGTLEQFRWFNDLQRASCSPENAARLFTEFTTIDVRELAPQVTCPTLVLHARDDARVPYEEGRILAALIPNARFVTLESRNHLLLEGEPALRHYMDEVDGFLGTDVEPASGAIPAVAFAALTAREAEILDLIARGMDNTAIASRLQISAKTLRNHITNIFAKLGLTSRAQAIVRARDAGLGRSGHQEPS